MGDHEMRYPTCFSGAPGATLDPNVPVSSYWWWYSQNTGNTLPSPLAEYVGGVTNLQNMAICPLNKTSVAQGSAGGVYGFPYVVNYNVMATTQYPLKRTTDISNQQTTIMMVDSVASSSTWGPGFRNTTAGWTRVATPHLGKVNVLWCDGHVSNENKADLTDANCTGQ